MESYLKWRGDLTFSERPFCEVDNLVLSELAYLDLAGIVPDRSSHDSISIAEAARLFTAEKRTNKCAHGPSGTFLQTMTESNRFRDVALSNFTEIVDAATQTDFSALHIDLLDGTVYVAFRGTSDSLLGWREDFSMSFQQMPSQTLAAEYLDATMDRSDVHYRVGGHSKGGNLAVYAAMMLPAEKLPHLLEIYSNDGPGLCPELVDMVRYRAISHKLIRIVPEFCIIGALFEHESPTRIVKSSAAGVHQHDGATWQVEGDHFCTCPTRSAACEFYNQIFDQWIESTDMEQRRTFTRDLFDALEASGAKRRTDLSQSGFDGMESILLSMIGSEAKTKLVIGKLFRSLITAFGSMQFATLLREKETIQGAVLFLIGLLFILVPGFAARCVGVGLGVIGAVWLGKRIYDLAFTGRSADSNARGKLVLNLVLLCTVVFFIGQGSLLLYLSNYLIGGFFLIAAYRWMRSAFDQAAPMRRRTAKAALAAVSFCMGMVPIITAGLILWPYIFTAGTFLLLYGAGKLVHAMYENGRQNAQGGLYG